MDFIFFIKGVAIGLMASIPLGPIGVLCIQRTINKKFKSGFISGLGAASADTVFAIVAIFFLSIVTVFIEERLQLLTLIGGGIITAIGISIFNKKMSPMGLRRNRAQNGHHFKDYISTFLLTLTNPAFIFVFVGLFTSFDITNEDLNIVNGIFTVVGVTMGASLWWFTLTFIVNHLKNKFRPRHLIVINKVAGILIFSLGAFAIISALLNIQTVNKII
ncbi:MAG: LysE family transporter [Rikenellaceae bacterium]